MIRWYLSKKGVTSDGRYACNWTCHHSAAFALCAALPIVQTISGFVLKEAQTENALEQQKEN